MAVQPPRQRWSLSLPDLSGSLALVTGASDGVGFEIARALVRAGADVVLPVRDHAKGTRVVECLLKETPDARVSLRDLELSSLASVESLVRELTAEGRPIDVFVANAGMIALRDPVRHTSIDGYELHFQTNFLGHAGLILGVMPLLRAGNARVALQCSLAAAHFRLDWDDLQVQRRYSAIRAYASSKICLGLFGMQLHRQSAREGTGIRAALCHPGVAATNIAPPEMRDGSSLTARLGSALIGHGPFGQSVAEAALPALHAVTSADAVGGRFYGPSGAFHLGGPPNAQRLYRSFADPADGARLWAELPALLAASAAASPNPNSSPPRTT
jgi:NAD(P)-dependent dehydrogenase (short-subunit alcohol dehydrogenase family)